MMNLNDFLHLTEEQQHEILVGAYDGIESAYDRYRALIAVEEIACITSEDDE